MERIKENFCSKKRSRKRWKENKRNKSVGRSDISHNKNKSQVKNVKIAEEKKCNSLLNTNNEDSLKRHKSFYKEMNKLFKDDEQKEKENTKNSINNKYIKN